MAQRISEARRDRFARITAALPDAERASVLDSLTCRYHGVESLGASRDP